MRKSYIQIRSEVKATIILFFIFFFWCFFFSYIVYASNYSNDLPFKNFSILVLFRVVQPNSKPSLWDFHTNQLRTRTCMYMYSRVLFRWRFYFIEKEGWKMFRQNKSFGHGNSWNFKMYFEYPSKSTEYITT